VIRDAVAVDRLLEIPVFRNLPNEVLEKLRSGLQEISFSAGSEILREGQYCDGAYYLIEGIVEVRFRSIADRMSTRGTSDSPEVIVPEVPMAVERGEAAVLGAGDIFGEGSALSRFPIATDIVAVSDVRCLLIRTNALREMFDRPELAAFKALFDDCYKRRALRSHLTRADLLADLDSKVIDRLADSVELVTFKPGKVIAQEGTPADALYLVRGGYVKVSARTDGTDVVATYLRQGDSAGETAILLDEPWPFSLTAVEHVELVKLTRARMQTLLAQFPSVEGRLWQSMMRRLKQARRAVADPVSNEPLAFAVESGLIHGESVLLIDLETCTRCDECVRGCADAHNGLPRFVREGTKFKNFSVPTACYHCTDPVCMIGCPTGAITRPLGTREVSIADDLCIGCGNCVRRCPWQNITAVPYSSPTVGEIGLATKCDLCIGRDSGPACVQMCPHGAAVRVNFKHDEQVNDLLTR
jgi:CRP-like cAMP-binding protein/Fe-S-cluster-containing hydrogenase component 2